MTSHTSLLAGVALLAVCAALLAGEGTAQAAGNSITSPVMSSGIVGGVGEFASLALDASGNPVASFSGNDVLLTVLHCNDPNCSGGDESVTEPAAEAWFTSLVLDELGNPVVSYMDLSVDLLSRTVRILHCNDPNCSGGDESITSPDSVPVTGYHTALALDADGHPVVSHYSDFGQELTVVHCNDANCAGGNESIESHAAAGSCCVPYGRQLSMAVDSSGNPVIVYWGPAGHTVMHCNDPNCDPSVNGAESVTAPFATSYGLFSLQLDAAGNPVISYSAGFALGLLHCNDANCAAGGESIMTPDTSGNIDYTSLALDAAGNPVIAYNDGDNADLKVVHCNDPNCSGMNGLENPTAVDTAGNVGAYPSLALDSLGNPIVAYHVSGSALRVLHCVDPDCFGKAAFIDTDGDGCTDAEELGTHEEQGGRRDPNNPYDFYDTDGNRVIDLFIDIFAVAYAFGDDADSDPPGEPDGYDATLDRSAAPMGMDVWDMGPPDGTIDLFTDIFGVAYQYGHDCT